VLVAEEVNSKLSRKDIAKGNLTCSIKGPQEKKELTNVNSISFNDTLTIPRLIFSSPIIFFKMFVGICAQQATDLRQQAAAIETSLDC
jgi:hypothetical protein